MPTVKTKRTGSERNETAAAIREAAAMATADAPVQPTAATKIVTLRLTEYEYNELTSAYAKHGVKLATGIKTAALWLLQSGATVTRAGVFLDRRD
jgi:hypothetical protein